MVEERQPDAKELPNEVDTREPDTIVTQSYLVMRGCSGAKLATIMQKYHDYLVLTISIKDAALIEEMTPAQLYSRHPDGIWMEVDEVRKTLFVCTWDVLPTELQTKPKKIRDYLGAIAKTGKP